VDRMIINLLCQEITPGLEAWFNKHAGEMNAEFKKENKFDKIYKHIPNIVRSKIPMDFILANRDKFAILDSYSIKMVSPGIYQIQMIFNETTLEAFDMITQAINVLPKWVRKQVENNMYKNDGGRVEDITRIKIAEKTIRAIQYDDKGNEEVIILEKKIIMLGV